MYECGEHFFHSTYECACAAQDTTTSKMKEIVEIYKTEIEKIHSINRGMQENIDICHKEPEICEAYPEKITAHFEDIANITNNKTVNGASLLPQGKQNGDKNNGEEDIQLISYRKYKGNNSNENNANKKIEHTTSNQIDQIAIKQNENACNQIY